MTKLLISAIILISANIHGISLSKTNSIKANRFKQTIEKSFANDTETLTRYIQKLDAIVSDTRISEQSFLNADEIKYDKFVDTLQRYNQLTTLTINLASNFESILANSMPLSGHQQTLISYSLKNYAVLLEDMVNIESGLSKNITNEFQELVWLESFLSVIESYKSVFTIYLGNTKLKKVLLDKLKIDKTGFSKIASFKKKIINRVKINQALKYFAKISNGQYKRSVEYNTKVVKRYALYASYTEGNFSNKLISDLDFYTNSTQEFISNTTSILSKLFGSVAGNIKWRRGNLDKNRYVLRHMNKNLKPFDLLLEKRAFLLTDYTIPGNWGHIGVYLGTKEQLKKLKLWNSPAIAPFKSKIEKGYSIFEVRRSGVQFSNLKKWLNVDEVAIIRVKSVSKVNKESKELILNNLKTLINRTYDFNFDAMTSSTITCSEIITFSYGPILWPSSYTLGRTVIAPDNMAELALYENSPIEFVTYIRGKSKKAYFLTELDYAHAIGYKRKITDKKYYKVSKSCKTKLRRNNRNSYRIKNQCKRNYTLQSYEAPLTF